jgi:CHAT domain-containing protein
VAADPLESSVQLADGALTVRDLVRARMSTRLLTLSACQAGFAEITEGDELVGWTRAAMYAGARAVLTPLWSVDAGATRAWMADFYRCWLTSRGGAPSLAESHRQATLTALARSPDPWHWAPYVLMGDGR